MILERGPDVERARYEYRLLATSKTSTLQKELADVGQQGFMLIGLTVAETAMGGAEMVAILRRRER